MEKRIKKNNSINLLFLGDSQTGKSFIIQSLIDEKIVTRNLLSTIGIEKMIKTCQSNIQDEIKTEFNLIIFDTSGQERFRGIISSLFRFNNLDGLILIYSTKHRRSFKNIESIWIDFIKNYYNDISKVNNLWIIGNKFDVDKNDTIEEVLEEEGEELAKKYGASFILFSNKDPYILQNINENIKKNCRSKEY